MRLLRGLLIVIGSLVGLIVVLVLALNAASMARTGKSYDVQPAAITIPSDSASMARGRHLVTAVSACTECHGPDLGGQTVMDSPVMGRLAASNLTFGRGGIGGQYDVEDWVRAVRHGVGTDGKALVMMPADAYQHLSDADLGAVIAYVKAQPPVDRERPKNRVGPLARALHVAVGLPLAPAEHIDHAAKPASYTPGVNLQHGEYLANGGGCRGCHGPALAGAHCPNITPGALSAWSSTDFERALREGKRPDGTDLVGDMPWKSYRGMTDDEIQSLWLYVSAVPAVAVKK